MHCFLRYSFIIFCAFLIALTPKTAAAQIVGTPYRSVEQKFRMLFPQDWIELSREIRPPQAIVAFTSKDGALICTVGGGYRDTSAIGTTQADMDRVFVSEVWPIERWRGLIAPQIAEDISDRRLAKLDNVPVQSAVMTYAYETVGRSSYSKQMWFVRIVPNRILTFMCAASAVTRAEADARYRRDAAILTRILSTVAFE